MPKQRAGRDTVTHGPDLAVWGSTEAEAVAPATKESPGVMGHRFTKLDILERVRVHLKHVAGEPITVPGIVVVGAQSAGKSSVLEHATGLAFPRGENTCTRVPTVVSIESIPEADADATGLIVATDASYTQDMRSIDPGDTQAFGDAIRELTDLLAPEGSISDRCIYVKYRRAQPGPTFTLTDVPGITFVKSGQDDIEKVTTNLTRKMIAANDQTLVLVVLPANDDFGNSKALKIAEEEDPDGRRTIGVVTKIDNLPDGSDIVKKMSGADLPLNHGYFAVRNRTQKEIEQGLSIADLEAKERTLFATDSVLSKLPPEQCGMALLLAKLVEEQGLAVDAAVPKLRRDVAARLRNDQAALDELPASLVTDTQRTVYVSKKLATFTDLFRRCCQADTSVLGTGEKKTNLSARVHEELQRMTHCMKADMRDFLSDELKDELLQACNESRGYDLPTFLSSSVFRETFAKEVPRMEFLATNSAKKVATLVNECAELIGASLFPADVVSPGVARELAAMLEREILRRSEDIHRVVIRLARAEQGNTYTNNHYLTQTIDKFDELVCQYSNNWKLGGYPQLKDGERVPEEFLRRVAESFRLDSNETASVRKMQIALHAYGKVVHKRYSDSAALLVKDEMLKELYEGLPELAVEWTPRLAEALVEDKTITMRRKELGRSIAALKKALIELEAL